MVIMDCRDLLTEVSRFLTGTLAQERLSVEAERARQQLITRLAMRESSPPQAYIDMNGSSYCNEKFQHQISDCYEEFDNSFDNNPKSTKHKTEGYMNNLYNNFCSKPKANVYANNDQDKENYINIKHSNQFDDEMYINPSSPLANTPVIQTKPSLPVNNSPSNSNSGRNSVVSFKKDSPDRTSDCSSYTSSSTRCDESPEVLAMSASALRYAAAKSGTLGRKEKFLFVDHTKLYWVAVLNQTLFVFNNDKDCKPLYELDITGYQARPVTITSNSKNDFKFELVSPGKKTHQFIAERQCDLEKWITVLNAATRSVEAPRECSEWPRQLPPPPTAQETYDQPDSAVRPVLEAEYELPDVLLRPHRAQLAPADRYSRRSSSQSASMSPKEMRRLPLLPHEQQTYDKPEAGVRPVNSAEANSPELYESVREELYHSIDDDSTFNSQVPKDSARRLPLLPHELEMYDQPEPTVRPVRKPESIIQEEFYSVIDNNSDSEKPDNEKAVYKNVDTNDDNEEDESNYYNLVPYPERETDQECIYDVITEQRQLKKTPTPISQLSSTDTAKQPVAITKLPTINSSKTEIRPKFEETKKLSPFVSNMTTIFNKPYVKPQLREIKPPIVHKSYQ